MAFESSKRSIGIKLTHLASTICFFGANVESDHLVYEIWLKIAAIKKKEEKTFYFNFVWGPGKVYLIPQK
jgi:hypothetical protein